MPRKPNESPKARWLPNQNRWQIKVQKDGIRKTFTCSTVGRKGKYECEEKAQAWLRGETHNTATLCGILLTAYVMELYAVSGGTSGTGHARQSEGIIRCYIKPKIDKKRLCDVTEGVLQGIINDAYGKKKKNAEPLSKKTLENIRSVIRAFIKWCRSHGLTSLVPENLKIPRGAASIEKDIIFEVEIKKLLSASETQRGGVAVTDWYINAYRFAVAIGLRPGELVGLQRGDCVDGVLYIRRSINTAGEVTGGKTQNAKRRIALAPFQQSLWAAQMEQLRKAGIVSAWAFPTERGDGSTQKQLYKAWLKYMAHNGIPRVSLYELRHTWVSIFGKDMPDNLVKRVVGHSKAMSTRDTYGHGTPDDDAAIIAIMEQKYAEIMGIKQPTK